MGIGTDTPSATYKVTISGTDTIFPAIYLENTTNTQAYSIRATGTNFVVRDNTLGNDRLTISSGGLATFNNGTSLPLLQLKTSRTDISYGIELYHSSSNLYGYIGGTGAGVLTGAVLDDLIIRAQTNLIFATGGNNRRLTISSGGDATFKESVNFNNKGCIKAANGSIQNGTATVTITPNNFNGVMQIMVGVYGNGEGSSARALWFCGGYISGNMGVSELVRVNGGSIVISGLTNPGGNTLTFTVQYIFPNAADISVTCIGNNQNTSPIEIVIT